MSNVVLKNSKVINNTGSNGGDISQFKPASRSPSGVFPMAEPEVLVNGDTRYRKLHWHYDVDATGKFMITPYASVNFPSVGGDHYYLIDATDVYTQGDIVGTERKYGAGLLSTAITAGDTTFNITVADATLNTFQSGDVVKIQHILWDDINNVWGAVLTTTIEVQSVAVSGNTLTITCVNPITDAFVNLSNGEFNRVDSNGFVIEAVAAFSLLPFGDVNPATSEREVYCKATASSVTSAGGSFDETQVLCNARSTVDQVITLEFTSGSAFTATGNTIGAMGTGSILASFEPVNPDYSLPYLIIPPDAFSGTFTAGDTIDVTVKGAYVSFFSAQVIPPATDPYSNNLVTHVFYGGG